MVDPEKQVAVLESLSSYIFLDNYSSSLNSNNILVFIFILALSILIVKSIIKYTSDVKLISLNYKLYLKDAHQKSKPGEYFSLHSTKQSHKGRHPQFVFVR